MKLCLDAGHSGKTNPYLLNGSTIGSEAEMAWKLQQKLREQLQAAGVEVLCTRSSPETDMGLLERGRMAEGCELFLSLHSNAGSPSADYPLACCPVDGSADEIGLRLAEAVGEVMGTAQSPRLWKRDYLTGTGTMLQTRSDPAFGKRTAANDYYGVLRGAAAVNVPGVLLECSFHTHPKMVQWLTKDTNLDALAKALCRVLTDYYRVYVPDWETKYNDLRADYDRLIGELKMLIHQQEGAGNGGKAQ